MRDTKHAKYIKSAIEKRLLAFCLILGMFLTLSACSGPPSTSDPLSSDLAAQGAVQLEILTPRFTATISSSTALTH